MIELTIRVENPSKELEEALQQVYNTALIEKDIRKSEEVEKALREYLRNNDKEGLGEIYRDRLSEAVANVKGKFVAEDGEITFGGVKVPVVLQNYEETLGPFNRTEHSYSLISVGEGGLF